MCPPVSLCDQATGTDPSRTHAVTCAPDRPGTGPSRNDPAATDNPVVAKLDGIVLVVRFGPMVRATVTFDRGKATVQGWSVLR